MLSLRSILTSLLLLSAVFAAGCGHAGKAAQHKGPGIGGTVIYITNTKLPDTAVFEIRLLRLDRDGNIEAVLASDSLPRPPSMPLEFWLPYQPGLIESQQAYAMDAKVVAAGRILFASQLPVPVLTRGNPTNVEIVVTPFK